MDTPITIGILAGCAALVLILVLLSLHILRKESAYLRERSRNGEILLLLSGMIGGKVAAGSQEPGEMLPGRSPAEADLGWILVHKIFHINHFFHRIKLVY